MSFYLCTFLKILWAKQFSFFWGGGAKRSHMLQPWFCSGWCLMELLVRMCVSLTQLRQLPAPISWNRYLFGDCTMSMWVFWVLTQVQAIVLSKSSEFPVGITCRTQIFSYCVACVMVHLWTMCQHESLHIVHMCGKKHMVSVIYLLREMVSGFFLRQLIKML